MADILKEILKDIPDSAKISSAVYEGANIVLYTLNREFFFDNNGLIKELVDKFKKRIEVRPDPSMTMDTEKAKELIQKIIPKEAGEIEINFDPQRSQVVIETEKPGLAIGKSGELLKEIKNITLWVPLIKRIPAIHSKIIENIRQVLYENNDYRKTFLNKIGERIYTGWIKERRSEWIRASFLGGARQVGRSCILLQTPESKILLDCGVDIAAPEKYAYPYFDAPEFNINELDAVIITHSHLDHCLPPSTPVLLKNGVVKAIDNIKKGDELVGIDWKTGKKAIGKCTGTLRTKIHDRIYKIKTPYSIIEASYNHKFFIVDNLEIKEIKASELKKGMVIPTYLEDESKINRIELDNNIEYDERVKLSESAIEDLKNNRKKRKWLKKDICSQLGSGINYIYDLENKYNSIYFKNLNKILRLYGINIKDFIKKHNIKKINFPLYLEEELAQCVGYLLGDGHPSSDYSIRITDQNIPCLNVYNEKFNSIFNHEGIIRHHPDKNKNAHVLEINNIGIKKYIEKNFECIFNKSQKREIPQKIIFSSNKTIRTFLRGFADAEGCIKNNCVSICSSSQKLLEQLQYLFSCLSIHASINQNTINISNTNGLKRFKELINFSHPDKKNKLEKLVKSTINRGERLREVLPVNSKDLEKIFIECGIKGNIHKSQKIEHLATGGIVSCYRKKEGCLERKNVNNLVQTLKKRTIFLKKLKEKDIWKKRIGISLSREGLVNTTGISIAKIQLREEKQIKDEVYKKLEDILNGKLDLAINKTNDYINKLKRLTNAPILWQRITNINISENEYDYLVDIEVEPTKNFIANNIIVHNCGMVPMLFKYGYRGPVYCTEPTRDISALLCLDYISVAFKEAKKALFSSTDIKEMVKHTICLNYEEVYDITPDVRITLYNSGHTLGSAMIHLHIGNGLHNLLYSLDWKTSVTIIDSKDNVYFKPIGEIIDKKFKESQNLIEKRGNIEEVPNLDGTKTIAFNPKTYKTEITPITSFIRHPINEDLYELKTASGRIITVTKSHSVFSVREGQVEAVKISDLKTGDFIIGPKKIPNINREPEINLLEHTPKLRVKINNNYLLNEILNSYKDKLNKLKRNDANESLNWIQDHYKFANYKYEIAKKYKVHQRRITRVFNKLSIKNHPRVKHILPEKLKITKDFARFLGYYISEGCPRKNSQTIQISNTNYKILEDSYNIIKETFGIEGSIRYKDDIVLFHSKQLKYLISNVLNCGENAYNKRVPSQILLASEDIISNFLYGYFSGDGGIANRSCGRSINASSKSHNLIQDITFLLLQFEIVPTLTYNNYTKMYVLSIYNSSKIKEFIDKIGIENKHIIELIPNLIRQKNKGSFDLRVPKIFLSKKGQLMLSRSPWQTAKSCNRILLGNFDLEEIDKKLIKSDLMFDQIKDIKKVKPSNKYVYDFKVKNFENFLGGEGFLFLHNTGDLKYLRTKILEAAVTKFPRLETVIIEATYGGKDNILPPRKECEDQLIKIIKGTVERKGKTLIPVLGVGRAQEVMVIIEELIRRKELPEIPVFVQGMVWDVTAIHTAYPDFLNNNIKKAIFHRDQNPFLSPIFKRVGSSKERKQILEETGPCLILATSGMLTGGASVEFFRELADNPKNSIVFVCYQGEGSLGRRIQSGEKQITMEDENGKPRIVEVKLEVHTIEGLTGHAGRNELIKFIYNLDPRPKKIIVNHGENSRCLDLASSLHKLNKIETNAPKNLEAVRIR